MKTLIFTLAASLLLLAGCNASVDPQSTDTLSATEQNAEQSALLSSDDQIPNDEQTTNESFPQVTTKHWYSRSLPAEAANIYDFSVEIPVEWEVAYVPEIEAINFYRADQNNALSPQSKPSPRLESSQVFMRYFRASEFLTLNTVTIHDREESILHGRPAVIYDIEKKPSASDFPFQPRWRNQRHFVTDIRTTDDNLATFYVIGRNPALDEQTFTDFIDSMKLFPDEREGDQQDEPQDTLNVSIDIFYPVENFTNGITLKPFGIFISPESSPVQPERFSGYHTGVDVEANAAVEVETGSDAQGDQDIPVFAIADGKVLLARRIGGYGGVMIIVHKIDQQDYSVLYGHLDEGSFRFAPGDTVTGGEQIAVLGKGYTKETDGERQHLHFSIKPGITEDVRGYVQTEPELGEWLDPLTFFEEDI